MAELGPILDDLAAEGDDLDRLVADLPADRWATLTPADGWTIAHQIAHLLWTDAVATLSANDPVAFAEVVKEAWTKPTTFVDEGAEELAGLPADVLLARWRSGRAQILEALCAVAPGRKLDWFGPPMAAGSMATARIMETWAHGQDVADTLGVTRTPTARIKHVAHIGIRARNFAYGVHQQPPPSEEFRVELEAPDGSVWTWGPDDATQRVAGPALDFALLVTQRRHLDDLAVKAVGPDAQHWLTIAQSFAGAPGTGRTPGQFAGALNS
ncbi:TIGR03084 family metal-binding protein [Antrihabitans sp. YC2-6]|uniref:TIGR03084 family metal-binding protein n=1 Tax=Antrihabitans sp. YC2-6 TaxID=2799498 RepID=UPI0018F67732|nr:TIGR03084 family metal-binding protein [Antrihabitans sp. YC2-6]MBJ8346530.1 TIGR03084 family protein [Antrihabitans sp. YC2-6]